MPCNKFSMLFISTSRSASRELLLFLSRRKGKDYLIAHIARSLHIAYIIYYTKEKKRERINNTLDKPLIAFVIYTSIYIS
jgi:hypothetical protein